MILLFYFVILLIPMNNHPLWTRVVGPFTVIKYVGAALFLYAAAHLFVRSSPCGLFKTWQSRWFLIFVGMFTCSFLATHSTISMSGFMPISYLSFLLMVFITVVVVDSLQRLRWVVLCVAASGALTSVYILREWQVYHTIYPGFRPGFITGDCNLFAASALITLPFAYFVIVYSRVLWEKCFCAGCIVITLVAEMLAASRGAFLGLAAGTLLVVCRSRRPGRNLAVILLVMTPLAILAPSSPLERLLSPDKNDDRAANVRLAIWHAGVEMIRRHPLFGVGAGNFKAMSLAYQDASSSNTVPFMAHDVYLEITAEMGLVAGLTFIAMLCAAFWNMEQERRRTCRAGPSIIFIAAQAIQVALLSFAVAACFNPVQYQKIFWFILAVSMCLPHERGRLPKTLPDANAHSRWPVIPALINVASPERTGIYR